MAEKKEKFVKLYCKQFPKLTVVVEDSFVRFTGGEATVAEKIVEALLKHSYITEKADVEALESAADKHDDEVKTLQGKLTDAVNELVELKNIVEEMKASAIELNVFKAEVAKKLANKVSDKVVKDIIG